MGLQHRCFYVKFAIFLKRLLLIPSNPLTENLRSFICLTMGAFHACYIFLSVTEKCFGYAAYCDIIIEIGFLGPATTEQVFNSKHCNHGICVVKTILQALLSTQEHLAIWNMLWRYLPK